MKTRLFDNPFLKHKKRIFSIMYSWGAAIILTGVLFKLTNLPYATEMLFVGMISEIIVFFFSAFDPTEKKESPLPLHDTTDQVVSKAYLEIAQLNQNIQHLNTLIEELVRKEHHTPYVDKEAEANTEKMISALADMNKSYLSILQIQNKVLSKQQSLHEKKYDE